MSDGDAAPRDARAQARRKARLDAIFGDVLPEVSADERARISGREGGAAGADEWLRRNVPPHHG